MDWQLVMDYQVGDELEDWSRIDIGMADWSWINIGLADWYEIDIGLASG